jgi:hypothetical protein
MNVSITSDLILQAAQMLKDKRVKLVVVFNSDEEMIKLIDEETNTLYFEESYN